VRGRHSYNRNNGIQFLGAFVRGTSDGLMQCHVMKTV
jgi:hypothetical protein